MVASAFAKLAVLSTHPGVMMAAAVSKSKTSSVMSVDIIEKISQSDLVGWLCLGSLAVLSVISWGVILLKWVHIASATRQTRDFIEQCVAGASSLEEAYKSAGDYPDSPVSQLLREAYLELEMENWFRIEGREDHAGRLELARYGIERVLERTIATEIDHLESYLIFLATTSNVAPFIGLFGTVWGVLVAFNALATQGSAGGLTTLSGGIATALISTIGGLVVAIPSSVLYNYLSNKVKMLTSRMDSFALELTNIIQKQIAREGQGAEPRPNSAWQSQAPQPFMRGESRGR